MRRSDASQRTPLTTDYILSKDANYVIDIAGHKFSAVPHLHAPVLPQKNQNSNYKPTLTHYLSDIST